MRELGLKQKINCQIFGIFPIYGHVDILPCWLSGRQRSNYWAINLFKGKPVSKCGEARVSQEHRNIQKSHIYKPVSRWGVTTRIGWGKRLEDPKTTYSIKLYRTLSFRSHAMMKPSNQALLGSLRLSHVFWSSFTLTHPRGGYQAAAKTCKGSTERKRGHRGLSASTASQKCTTFTFWPAEEQ